MKRVYIAAILMIIFVLALPNGFSATCGNGNCEAGESTSCPQDCSVTISGPAGGSLTATGNCQGGAAISIIWNSEGQVGFPEYIRVLDQSGNQVWWNGENICSPGTYTYEVTGLQANQQYTLEIGSQACHQWCSGSGCPLPICAGNSGPGANCDQAKDGPPQITSVTGAPCMCDNPNADEASCISCPLGDNLGTRVWDYSANTCCGDSQTDDPDAGEISCLGCPLGDNLGTRVWGGQGMCCGDDADDCGKVSGNSICNIEQGSISWLNSSVSKGDIKYLECSNSEYLSEGNIWSQCNGTLWKKSVLSHDYLCYKAGRESIAECCGSGSCNSKTDGKRLQDGQQVVADISSGGGGTPLFTITPNPVVRGQTVLNARVTNTDPNFEILIYQKKDGVLINDGTPLGTTNSFGSLYTLITDTSTLGTGNYETYVMVNGKKSNTINWNVVDSAGQFTISPDTLIRGNPLTASITNSDSNSQITSFTSIDGRVFSSGSAGTTDASGSSSTTIQDTSSLAVGGYLTYLMVNGKQTNKVAWNVAASNDKPTLSINPASSTKGQTDITITVNNADTNSPIIFFISYNDEPYSGIPANQNTDSSGQWSLVLKASDTIGYDVGTYKVYVTINGKKSNIASWSVLDGTGQSSGPTYYCRTDNKFVTDLDTPEGKTTCEKAGFIWTGTKCCSEADDPNEYYNDQGGTGGCWSKAFVPGQYGFVNGSENSTLNLQGIFVGCAIDKSNYNKNNDNYLSIKDSHTGAQLVTNVDYCVSDNNYFCSYTERFQPTNGINRTHLSTLPISTSLQKAECCPQDKCWDGSKCIDSQKDKPFETLGNMTNSTTAFRCIDGEWTESKKKCTPDGAVCGFCPSETQCLIDPFAKAGTAQCIDSGKFVGDNYCNNGEWAARTNILTSTLLGLRGQDFSLFCDNKDNALNYLQYKTSSNEQALTILNRLKTNNVCVLKNPGQVIIGVTLNQDVNNISSKDWSVFKLQSCPETSNLDGNFHPCSSSSNVWLNANLLSIIYSESAVTIPASTDLLGEFKTLVKDSVDQIISSIQGMFDAPPVDDSYINGFTKLDRIFLETHQGKEAVAAIDGKQFKNLVAHYTSLDADICKAIEDFNMAKGLGSSGIACMKDVNDYYVLAQGGSLLNFNPDAVWQDLTSKLRIK